MHAEELHIAGAYSLTPVVHGDRRGSFHEWYRADLLAELTGGGFARLSPAVAQANCSVSTAGTLRGIHFAQVPPGQAKYITCFSGSVLDVLVDLRVGSPTYGEWDSVLLDDVDRRAVYLPEGLGHAFVALADGSLVSYLVSTPYDPSREHSVNALDPRLGIPWPTEDRAGRQLQLVLSDRDRAAPMLAEVEALGLLPRADRSPPTT